jgi:uncharacterized membrane protein
VARHRQLLTPGFFPLLKPARFLAVSIGIYVLVMWGFCLWRYYSSALGDLDYAVFDQSCWTTLKYHWLMSNGVEGGTHFAVHNSPIFLLLMPIYALAPGAPTLLFLQSLALGLGAIPVYLMAVRALPESMARWLAIGYLMYHPVHGVNFDQFNESAYATTPLLFAVWALTRERWRVYWIGCILALLVKEDEAFIVLLLGVYTMATGWRGDDRDRWARLAHGGLVATVAVAWGLFSFGWVLPHFQAQTGFQYFINERYGELGKTLPEVVRTIVTRPEVVVQRLSTWQRLWSIPDLLAPWAFLSLATPGLLLVSAPSMAINLLSNFETMQNSASRYPAPIIPFVVMSAIATLSRLPEVHQGKWLKTCIGLTFGFSLLATPSPPRLGFHLPWIDPHQRLLLRVADAIPEEWAVSTQDDILPHVCHRKHAWKGFREDADAILVDTTPRDRKPGETNKWYVEDGFPQSLQVAVQSGRWHLTWQQDGLALFTRANVPFGGPL